MNIPKFSSNEKTNNIIGIMVFIAVAIALYKLYTFFFGDAGLLNTGAGEGQGPETPVNYSPAADELQSLFNSYNTAFFSDSSDLTAIIAAFAQMKTSKDIAGLMKAFGTRTWYANGMFDWTIEDLGLAGWVGKLPSDEIAQINIAIKSTGFQF